MKQKKSLVTLTLTLGIILVLAGLVSANVPAPPVNQSIGFDDTIFNNLDGGRLPCMSRRSARYRTYSQC